MSKKITRDTARNERARRRAEGLRPLQIGVPDTRSEAFRIAAREQCLVVARSAKEREDQDFIDAVSELG